MDLSEPQKNDNGRDSFAQPFYVGSARIDPAAHEIVRDGKRHRVRQKLIRVISYLARHREEVVTREELLDQIWADQPSGDEVLTQVISELRKVLGDDPKSSTIIETVPKAGYRLVAPVRFAEGGNGSPESEDPGTDLNHEGFKQSALAPENKKLWIAVSALAVIMGILLIIQVTNDSEKQIIETEFIFLESPPDD